MKVAVSIPEPIFSNAERVAARMGTSRSALYARAVADFIERHDPDDITERLNAMVDEFGDEPLIPRSVRNSVILKHTEW